jgi:hypothetical protein
MMETMIMMKREKLGLGGIAGRALIELRLVLGVQCHLGKS